jgi:hypothetical protein
MLKGTIESSTPRISIIRVRVPVPETGGGVHRIERYCLLPNAVDFQAVETIQIGHFVRFQASSRPRRRPTDYLYAEHASVYESQRQAKEIDELLKTAEAKS